MGRVMTDDRAAYIRAVIRHRCPELTDANLAALDEGSGLPVEIADMVFDVIAEMEARLDELVAAIARTQAA